MTSSPSAPPHHFVLSLGCPDRTGIVADITGFLAECGASIVEAAYHADHESGWFYTRQAVDADSVDMTAEQMRAAFAKTAAGFGDQAQWDITDSLVTKKMVVLVSKESHCLHYLLGQIRSGDFPAEISAVIGNHPDLQDVAQAHGLPFHHVPFDKDPALRGPSFDAVKELVDGYDPDLIVLARFMQIVPEDLCEHWAGKAINIHHSFLPSFVGARPYHQAHSRGVKLIGATCHYVTGELDQGPIIEQDVTRIDHGTTISEMVRIGRDVEMLVLARGVRWHVENRVQVHGRKTVIFS